MSITLDELFTLFEEVEKSGILLEKSGEGKETKLVLPRLYLSEDFGKEGNVDRKELERVVYAATKGAGDAFDKLKVLNEQMQSFKKGTLGKVRSPTRILSQIMLLETFNRLFKSFGASPAGFINEGILSVFYKGRQEAVEKGNKEHQIGDVIDSEGNPISIKTKTDKAPFVEGSIFNLYNSINGNKNKKVIFDIYLKTKTGETEGGSGEVGSLTAYRFEVNPDNINQFLGQDIFTVDEQRNLVPKFAIKKSKKKDEEEELQQEALLKEKITEDGVKQFIDYILLNPDEKIDSMEKLTSLWGAATNDKKFNFRQLGGQGYNDFRVLLDKLNSYYKEIPRSKKEENKKQIIANLVSQIGNLQDRAIAQAGTSKDGKTLTHTDFKLGMSEWLPFAMKSGVQPVEIEFSDNTLRQVLERAVEDLNEDITSMFNALQDYNKTLQAYLTSITNNRSKLGQLAKVKAAVLPEKTNAVVKSAGVEDDQLELFPK